MIEKLSLPKSASLDAPSKTLTPSQFDEWVAQNYKLLDAATIDRVRSQASRQPARARFRIRRDETRRTNTRA